MVGNIPAGWYPEPTGRPDLERFFDGRVWTEQLRRVNPAFPAMKTARRTPPPPEALGQPPLPGSLTDLFTAADPAPTGPPVAGYGVDPESAQALLVDTARGWKLKRRPTRAEPGWYPDPARTSKLRFYDGRGWTSRTRLPLDERRRQLPAAAVALRAKMLELADEKAAGSEAGHRWRNPKTVIAAPQAVPSLHLAVRTRTGRVGGMISMAAIVTGLGFASFLGWQHWLSADYEQHVQAQMRHQLEAQMGHRFDHYGADPTPVDLTRETLPTDPAAPTGHPTTGGPSATPTPDPDPNPGPGGSPSPGSGPAPSADPGPGTGTGGTSTGTGGTGTTTARPRDLAPWPPTGWRAPESRRMRSVKEYRAGAPIGRVVVPRAGVDEVMVAGTSAMSLAKGVGVATWGVLPGEPGNATLAGHRTGHGGLFLHLDELRYGDQIIIEIPGQPRAVYEVRGYEIVSPHNTGVTRQTNGVRLTLTTCHPPGSTGQRYVIQAEMIEGQWLDRTVNRGSWKLLR